MIDLNSLIVLNPYVELSKKKDGLYINLYNKIMCIKGEKYIKYIEPIIEKIFFINSVDFLFNDITGLMNESNIEEFIDVLEMLLKKRILLNYNDCFKRELSVIKDELLEFNYNNFFENIIIKDFQKDKKDTNFLLYVGKFENLFDLLNINDVKNKIKIPVFFNEEYIYIGPLMNSRYDFEEKNYVKNLRNLNINTYNNEYRVNDIEEKVVIETILFKNSFLSENKYNNYESNLIDTVFILNRKKKILREYLLLDYRG